MTTRMHCLVLSALALALPIDAQKKVPTSNSHVQTENLPQFEAATVKPATADNYKPMGVYVRPGGRIIASQCTLKQLIEYAFDVRDFQIKGEPGWADTLLFDVTAVPPDQSASRQSAPKFINDAPTEEQRQMLKSLLASRFALRFHLTTKTGPVYFLARSGKPLKMDKVDRNNRFPVLVVGGRGNGGMSGRDIPMSYMAQRLSEYLGRPVIDQTGLAGTFDFKLDPPLGDSRDINEGEFQGEILNSVQTLGLKLKTGTGEVNEVVIEAAKEPTAD